MHDTDADRMFAMLALVYQDVRIGRLPEPGLVRWVGHELHRISSARGRLSPSPTAGRRRPSRAPRAARA